jgi:hypothetical protein
MIENYRTRMIYALFLLSGFAAAALNLIVATTVRFRKVPLVVR